MSREPMGGMQIGMGWVIRTDNGKSIHWHNGGTGGFRTFAGFDQNAGTAVVVLSNASISPDEIGFHLLDLDSKLTSFRSANEGVQLSLQWLDKLSGEYEINPQFSLRFWHETGQFLTQATGQGVLKVYAESETKFFLTAVEASLTFVLSENGDVLHVFLEQGGGLVKGTRIHPESDKLP